MEIHQENRDMKTPECYCKDLMVQMNECRLAKSLCDVKLVVEGVEFSAHRIVLAAGSPYFHGLFTAEMKEKQESKVVLKEIKASSMENVLEYLYTGKTEMTEDNAYDLMVSANYFLMDGLEEAASSCISTNLKLENSFNTIVFAKKYFNLSLEKKCKEFIKTNFGLIIDHEVAMEDFLDLEVEQIEEFFSSEETVISREEVMYETIKKWVEKSPATRKKHFQTLFCQIRLQHISRQYIDSVILKDELVTGNVSCVKFVNDTGSLPFSRRCFDVHIIVICGGYDVHYEITRSVMCFIPDATENTQWRSLPSLISAYDGCSSVFCDGFLYCIGEKDTGMNIYNDNNDLNKILDFERYDPATNSWLNVQPLSIEGYSAVSVATATLNCKVYVLIENKIYCYTPTLDEWHYEVTLEEYIYSACFVADLSSLYVIGGMDGFDTTRDTCTKIILDSKEYISLASMNEERSSASAMFKQGCIYIAGGLKDYESTNALANCERYSIENDQWEMFPRLQCPRYSAGMACVRDDIYILGGKHEGEIQNSVERYNESRNTWEVVTSMPNQSFFGCTIIQIPNVFSLSRESFEDEA